MQMNLQAQMGVAGATGPKPQSRAGDEDDNNFLNEDLPNLAAQIQALDDDSQARN